MITCRALSSEVGTAAACRSLDIARATCYRRLEPQMEESPGTRPAPPRALSALERQEVLEVLHTDRFIDRAPAEVYASLLNEGTYLCSVRTMYRILDEQGEVRELRDQTRHPRYKAPELLATGPNQVWSWDISSSRLLLEACCVGIRCPREGVAWYRRNASLCAFVYRRSWGCIQST